MRAAAAAAAAAASLLLSLPPLSMLLATGSGSDLSRAVASESCRAGERERRSKRDLHGGSTWSKRERLRGSSAMMVMQVELR